MKNFNIIGVLLGFAFLNIILPCFADKNVYHDRKLGFTVQFPLDWDIQAEKDFIFLTSPQKDSKLVINASSTENFHSLPELFNIYRKKKNLVEGDKFHHIRLEKRYIDKIEALQATYIQKLAFKHQLFCQTIFMVHKKRVFLFNYYIFLKYHEKFKQSLYDISSIISSFKLKREESHPNLIEMKTCRGIFNSKPIGITSLFPSFTEQITLFVSCIELPKNVPLKVEWYKISQTSQHLIETQEVFSKNQDNWIFFLLQAKHKEYLSPGNYRVDFFIKGKFAASNHFQIDR